MPIFIQNVAKPHKWVRLNRYCELTGDTSSAVHARRKKGVWIDGKHTTLAPDGKLWVERCPLTTEPAPGDFGTFDEFDRDGTLLRRVHLRAPGDPATDHLVHLADGRFVLIRNHHVTEDSEADDVELEVVLLE